MNKQNPLHFSPDFLQACEIFNLQPFEVIQQFIDSISLPKYFANPFDPNRWANTFMLECVLANIVSEDLQERYARFLDRITEAVLNNIDDKEAVGKQVLNEWHKAVLEDRIKDMMDDQDAEENNEL